MQKILNGNHGKTTINTSVSENLEFFEQMYSRTGIDYDSPYYNILYEYNSIRNLIFYDTNVYRTFYYFKSIENWHVFVCKTWVKRKRFVIDYTTT